MLVKAVQKDGLTIEMYKNLIVLGNKSFDAFTVICEGQTSSRPFSKSYDSLNEANTIFNMFVQRGGIWH